MLLEFDRSMSFTSSSLFVMHKAVYPTLSVKYNYETPEQCYEDRDSHREEWKQLIKKYNEGDLSRLAKELFVDNDIYVGMRDREEYEKGVQDGLFDVIVWIDRSQHLPFESTMEIPFDSTKMYFVDNNNDKKHTMQQMKEIFDKETAK